MISCYYHTRNSGDSTIHEAKNLPFLLNLNNQMNNSTAVIVPQKSLINFFFSAINAAIHMFNKLRTTFSDIIKHILPKAFWFIKVTPKINNFFASVIRRQITIIKDTHVTNLIYSKLLNNNLQKVYQLFFHDMKDEAAPTATWQTRFNLSFMRFSVHKLTRIFNTNEKTAFKRNQSYSNFPIRYNSLLLKQGFDNPRMRVLALIYKKYGYTYIGNKLTVTAVKLSNIERVYNTYGIFKQLDIQKIKNKRKYRKVRYLVKKAATYKPWFSRPVWKQILKRFKYNREAIFTHYRIRHVMKNKSAYYFMYMRGITQHNKKLFIQYKKNILNTRLSQIQNIDTTESLINYINNFFSITNKLLEKSTAYKFLNFIKKTMVTLKSYINIIQLKRRYNLHFHEKNRHNARLQYVPKTDVRIWTSAGKLGFHSNKRTTPFAAEAIGKYIAQRLKKRHIHLINLEFSQPFIKKIRSFYKGIKRAQMRILRIYYKRKIMFGHIRQPKQRRV